MTTTKYRIGVVCSGNTCRSPIFAAWLITKIGSRADLDVWTAGVQLNPEHTKVHDMPKQVAREMGLEQTHLTSLDRHNTRDLKDENRPTNLLVWITDPAMINAVDTIQVRRSERITAKAKAMGACVVVVPEPDNAWAVLMSGASEKEKHDAYWKQAETLKKWVDVVCGFIPPPSPPA